MVATFLKNGNAFPNQTKLFRVTQAHTHLDIVFIFRDLIAGCEVGEGVGDLFVGCKVVGGCG